MPADMKPHDITAFFTGTMTGAALSESTEQILAAAAASAAVYLIKYLLAVLKKRFPNLPEDEE